MSAPFESPEEELSAVRAAIRRLRQANLAGVLAEAERIHAKAALCAEAWSQLSPFADEPRRRRASVVLEETLGARLECSEPMREWLDGMPPDVVTAPPVVLVQVLARTAGYLMNDETQAVFVQQVRDGVAELAASGRLL